MHARACVREGMRAQICSHADVNIDRYAHGHVCMYACHSMCLGVTEHFVWVSAFPLCGSRCLNSGHWSWPRTPAPGLFIYTLSYLWLARAFFHSAVILHFMSPLLYSFQFLEIPFVCGWCSLLSTWSPIQDVLVGFYITLVHNFIKFVSDLFWDRVLSILSPNPCLFSWLNFLIIRIIAVSHHAQLCLVNCCILMSD